MNFATTIHNVDRTCPAGAFSLFSGRRTPHPPFHLLQHMYINEQLGGMATSSLFAGRALGGAGMPQQLIGTLAHEGPMGFMCLHPELDGNLPVRSAKHAAATGMGQLPLGCIARAPQDS